MSDNYLQTHFKGKYRILAELDSKTNDFVKDKDENLETSFSDFYIPCAYNNKIVHGTQSNMGAYITSKQRGTSILKQIWIDNTSEPLPKENADTKKYCENLCKELVNKNILSNAEILDFEVFFIFNVKDIEYYAKLLKAKTSGAKISPFSKKNLPKIKYTIPKKDLDEYKIAIKDFPTRDLGKRIIVDGIFIKKCNKDFLKKNKIKNNTNMKDKEYIHSTGNWEKYINYLKGVKI